MMKTIQGDLLQLAKEGQFDITIPRVQGRLSYRTMDRTDVSG